jgi:hypothetical protein
MLLVDEVALRKMCRSDRLIFRNCTSKVKYHIDLRQDALMVSKNRKSAPATYSAHRERQRNRILKAADKLFHGAWDRPRDDGRTYRR